jgi:hypothetical protein
MIALPQIDILLKRTKALAALDLIMSPDWQYRYYSFNSAWAPLEQMASMRNGCGDEWWIVFHDSGWAALKGLDHESIAWSQGRENISKAIQDQFPLELSGFATEPAFRWDSTSFAYFYLPSKNVWCYANLATPFGSLNSGDTALLHLLVSPASDYVSFASDYYEREIPVDAVESILSHQAITQDMINHLNPEVTLDEISKELFVEIGYPR